MPWVLASDGINLDLKTRLRSLMKKKKKLTILAEVNATFIQLVQLCLIRVGAEHCMKVDLQEQNWAL